MAKDGLDSNRRAPAATAYRPSWRSFLCAFLPAQRVQPAFGFRFFFVVGKRVSPVSDFFLGLGNEKHVPEQQLAEQQPQCQCK